MALGRGARSPRGPEELRAQEVWRAGAHPAPPLRALRSVTRRGEATQGGKDDVGKGSQRRKLFHHLKEIL